MAICSIKKAVVTIKREGQGSIWFLHPADPDIPGLAKRRPGACPSGWYSPDASPKWSRGGRRLRFNALVVVGDGQGQVGAGLGKALVIPDAVRKGNAIARRNMVKIPLKGSTIPQMITVKKGATIVIIKPAREGTGVIAAGAMRAMLELGGVKDVVGKTLGSRNPINIVYATTEALRQLRQIGDGSAGQSNQSENGADER